MYHSWIDRITQVLPRLWVSSGAADWNHKHIPQRKETRNVTILKVGAGLCSIHYYRTGLDYQSGLAVRAVVHTRRIATCRGQQGRLRLIIGALCENWSNLHTLK